MGALFASPVLSVLLVLEIANVNRTRYMEMIALLFTGACISFAVYSSFSQNVSFIFILKYKNDWD